MSARSVSWEWIKIVIVVKYVKKRISRLWPASRRAERERVGNTGRGGGRKSLAKWIVGP
jgi:hypothetical protein